MRHIRMTMRTLDLTDRVTLPNLSTLDDVRGVRPLEAVRPRTSRASSMRNV